ncbi:MAG: ABC transporter permease [Clostridiales bacterium]|nr:ABC transporter permease [Clostridiales bacterium]MBR3342312.1 ABC transporter permease [Clostridiales bacterium]
MRNVVTIVKKQLKDTLKNKTVLIQFVMFPVLTLIFEHAINIPDMPELFFAKLFSVMYMGMAPLTAVAAIISEEKEKNTLRVLMMANVKPWEYLIGVGIYVWTICMVGAGVIATSFPAKDIPFYLAVMAAGFIISIAVGACVGIFAPNQMVSTSMVLPVMLVFSFAPMLAMFNDKIEKIARIFYTQQIRILLNNMTFDGIKPESFAIVAVNALLAIILFFAAFRKKGLE